MDARTVVEMEVGDRVERLAAGFFFEQIARAQLFHRLAQCFRKLRVARPAGARERCGEPAPKLPLDAERLKQVAINLIRNALEAMPDGGNVVVEDGLLDGSACLRVRDDGPGLPKGHTPGVGLRSMRERAAELGGRCTAQNGTNGGTRVCAWLPIARDGSGGTAANPDRG